MPRFLRIIKAHRSKAQHRKWMQQTDYLSMALRYKYRIVKEWFPKSLISNVLLCVRESSHFHRYHKESVWRFHTVDSSWLHKTETTNSWPTGCDIIDCCNHCTTSTGCQTTTILKKSTSKAELYYHNIIGKHISGNCSLFNFSWISIEQINVMGILF